MIKEQTSKHHTRANNFISNWQLNLARRIAQILEEPGTYYFTIELDENGRKVFKWLNGEGENLGK